MYRVFGHVFGEESNSGIGSLVVAVFDHGNPVPEREETSRQPAGWPAETPLCDQN